MVDTVGTPNHYLEESHPGKIWDLHWYVWERNIYCGEAPILGLFSWEASMNCWLRKTGRDTYHVHFTDENTEAKKKNTQFVQDQNPVTDRAEIELIYWALKFVHFCCFFVFFFSHHVHVLWPSLHFPGQTSSCTSSNSCNRGQISPFPWIFGNKIHDSLPFVFLGFYMIATHTRRCYWVCSRTIFLQFPSFYNLILQSHLAKERISDQ